MKQIAVQMHIKSHISCLATKCNDVTVCACVRDSQPTTRDLINVIRQTTDGTSQTEKYDSENAWNAKQEWKWKREVKLHSTDRDEITSPVATTYKHYLWFPLLQRANLSHNANKKNSNNSKMNRSEVNKAMTGKCEVWGIYVGWSAKKTERVKCIFPLHE